MTLGTRISDRWHALVGLPPLAMLSLQVLAAMYLSTIGFLVLWVVAPAVLMGWTPTVVTSSSMAPTIRAGDVALIDGDAEITLGSVVTYTDPSGELVTHRVLDITEDGTYVTAGDANASIDAVAPATDDVLGRGTLVVPVVGLPAIWSETAPIALAVWVAVTVAAILLVVVVRPPSKPVTVEPPPPEDTSVWEWPDDVVTP